MKLMKSMLSVKLKNTPRDTSLVPGPVSCRLNKEETFSAYDVILADNFGEENQLRKEDRT